jgi:N-acetylglutamate synthase-like GNAT family acetyltransferase
MGALTVAEPEMPVTLRPAVAGDQPTIRRIVRAAQLNPLSLHWQSFLVAEDEGAIIGIGQVKPYRDGSRELASIAVIPQRQGQGIGSLIIRALLAREAGPLFLMCVDHNETFYARFGFRRAGSRQLPPALRRLYNLGWFMAVLARSFGGRDRLIVMSRP